MAEIIQFPERPLITFKRTETKAYLGAVLEALMSVKEDCQYLQDRAKSESPTERPYYIVEITLHYEIVGEVKPRAKNNKRGQTI